MRNSLQHIPSDVSDISDLVCQLKKTKHIGSAASSPLKTEHLEFYIKTRRFTNTLTAAPPRFYVPRVYHMCTFKGWHAFIRGPTGSQIADMRRPPFLLSVSKNSGQSKEKPLLHEFFRRAMLLALKSLSSTVCSCIFKGKIHTGQDATDF